MRYRERSDLPGYWSYDDRTVQADVEVHKFIVDYAVKHVPIGATVLDIAAGQGALSKALLDVGYDVKCTSWDDQVNLPIETFKVNLDHQISLRDVGQRRYPLICCIEIIEHVENPPLFLRSCRTILEEGGRLILSTPNVESAQARLQWLIRGCPSLFSDDEIRRNRHISMMWRQGLEFQIHAAGFDIHEKHLLGRFRFSSLLQMAMKRPLFSIMKFVLPGDLSGRTRLYVLSGAGRDPFKLAAGDVY